MKFHLEASFRLSADISRDAEEELAEFFASADDILQKGAAEGQGAKIVEWKLQEKEISLVIDSDRYVRAHDAILRLRRPLAQLLGKKYRVGIRGLDVEKFEIEVESKKTIPHKIPYVKKIKHQGGVLKLILDVGEDEGQIGESELKNKVPDRIVNLLDEKLQEDYGGKAEHWELLWESPKREPKFDQDPTEEMINKGWIKHGSSRGQWIYGPQGAHFFRTMENIVMEEIIEPLGYQEMIFPKLVTWDVWKKSGHAQGVYPEIYYVCPPKTRDPEFWEEVIDYYKVTRDVPTKLIKEKIGEPIGGMCYAQCPPSWVFFQGRTLPNDSLPVKFFDRSGTSHRYESGGIHGIERVDEFHRIEIVWMGTKEQVQEEADKLKERYKKIFEEILELHWRMAWVTPWFMAQEGKAGLSELNEAGTIDYEALLPYNGDWIEFQNLSNNGYKYPKGFNVKAQSGEQLWSGCSGVGLERWASAFLAQKGLDVENWPQALRDQFGEMPEGIRFL
ncbi:MAG: serine--tRNA ligase [Methanotrichaceae archaeon]